MNARVQPEEQRQFSAGAIESTIRSLVSTRGVSVASCTWNRGHGLGHSSHHCLDVAIKDVTVKVYFRDDELLAYWNATDRCSIESRLEQVISEHLDDPLTPPILLPLRRLDRHVRP